MAKGRSLTEGHPIFSQAARRASRRVASDGNSAREIASFERKNEREEERIQRDLSAFNGLALVKSCTKTLSTTLSKLCQQGLVANSWPRLPSYFEINGDLFMGDDTNVLVALRISSNTQTVLRGKRLCASLCRTICLQGCISRINARYPTVVVESVAFGKRSAKAKCLYAATKFK